MSLILGLITQHPLAALVITLLAIFLINKVASGSEPPAKAPLPEKRPPKKRQKRVVTRAELRKHNKVDDLWVCIDNNVYDITSYVDVHPGGDVIARNAGYDATKGFHGIQHPSRVYEIIEEFYVGELDPKEHYKTLGWEEVSKHNTEKDLWIVVNDKVLDVTEWAATHPGGAEVLLSHGGKDATEAFFGGQHSDGTAKMIEEYCIGYVYDAEELENIKLRDQSRRMLNVQITKEEVAKHDKREDCWLIIHDKVYNVTKFVSQHPGGDAILNNAGGDATQGFEDAQHGEETKEVLKKLYVGDLE